MSDYQFDFRLHLKKLGTENIPKHGSRTSRIVSSLDHHRQIRYIQRFRGRCVCNSLISPLFSEAVKSIYAHGVLGESTVVDPGTC